MKTLLGTLLVLCATSAFSQNIISSEVRPLRFSEHPEHASRQALANESSLLESSSISYYKGEVPLADLGSPIYYVPLGDLARSAKKEHINDRKAVKSLED
jgi:hypothetical protein